MEFVTAYLKVIDVIAILAVVILVAVGFYRKENFWFGLLAVAVVIWLRNASLDHSDCADRNPDDAQKNPGSPPRSGSPYSVSLRAGYACCLPAPMMSSREIADVAHWHKATESTDLN